MIHAARFIRMALVAFTLLAALTMGQAATAGAQGGPTPTTCGAFETQEAAQAYLDEEGRTAEEIAVVDPDGNGTACEDAFPVGAGSVAVLTVRGFLCEASFDDMFNTCTEPVADTSVTVSIDGTPFSSDVLDAEGAVSLADLPTGDFLIELGVPGDFASFRTACSGSEGTEGLTHDGANTNRIGIELGDGAAVTCTFFVLPDDASGGEALVDLTVQAFLCETSFDDMFNSCVEPLVGTNVTVTIDGSEFGTTVTGADGSVSLTDLPTGDVLIDLGVSSDVATFRTVCSAPGASEALTHDGVNTNQIGIELGDGAQPTCTFFALPNDAGTPPVDETPVATVTPIGGTDDDDDDMEVIALPDTGVGPADRDTESVATAGLVLAAAVVALAALRVRATR